jgi:hypothetical protein
MREADGNDELRNDHERDATGRAVDAGFRAIADE